MGAIVIGAGPAGLAVAACLKRVGVELRLLEKADRVGEAWHRHYDRLHLHTPKYRSSLPGLPMPREWPRYPSRTQVVDYLAEYTRAFDLQPVLGAEVTAVERAGAGWRVTHGVGTDEAEVVVFATGLAERPARPDWPGLEGFPGPVVHSSDYRNPKPFRGCRMLVVGFGNSGGEIALDLAEAGCPVDMVVRRPVNLLPRELLGIPIASFEILQRILPHRTADRITAPLLRLAMGDYAHYGLRKSAKGPVTQVREEGRVPLIDIGTLDAIREGRITVRPALARFDGRAAVFADGGSCEVDAVVLATGYRVDLRPILGPAPDLLDAAGRPRIVGGQPAAPGLYFCSYRAAPNGQLRQIGREARAIAADVAGAASRRAA